MKRALLTLCLAAGAAALAVAYDPEAVRKELDRLVTAGNRAYEESRRSAIEVYADSIHTILWDIMFEDELDNDFIDYTASYYKLRGNCEYESGYFADAESYYNDAMEVINTFPDVDFRNTRLVLLRDMAQLHYRTGDYRRALECLEEVDDMLQDGLYDIGGDDWLVARLTYAITLARLDRISQALAIAKEELARAKDKKSLAYARAERMYAKILTLAEADRKGALKAYKDYFETQKKYARDNFARMDSRERSEYWQSLQPFMTDCYRLEDADPAFLYDVALFSKGLLLYLERGGDIAGLGHTHKDIARRLGKKDVAIEFVAYEKDGYNKMAALVLGSNGKVKYCNIGSANTVESMTGDEFGNSTAEGKNELYGDAMLQRQVWNAPLLNLLKDAGKIYFAPDGYLHRLAIEYFPQVEGRKLYRLSSTRRLMEPAGSFDPKGPMLLVGRIDFDFDENPGGPVGNDEEAYRLYQYSYFPDLGSATDEAFPIYLKRSNPADCLLAGSEASEYAFRSLAPDYSMILVSTHGSFVGESPVATDIKEIYDDRSLSESAIAFAGVNSHLEDYDTNYGAYCDGLLSAGELQNLDLSKCGLFAASACQTALGHITSDGVFGLQRALKKSGVDAMLVSLWNVNSLSTCLLMSLLYSNLEEGMPLKEAFDKARRALLEGEAVAQTDMAYQAVRRFDAGIMAGRYSEILEELPDYSEPRYSNAFILIDAIE